MKAYWKTFLSVSLCAAITGGIWPAQAASPSPDSVQGFPSKPIRIVVGFTPGGVADIAARVVATKLAENWKQQVVVDNRPGAGSAIGTGIVASSDPNGYTMISVSAAHAIMPALYSKLPFDSVRDFAGVAVTCTGPLLLIASSSADVKSVKELIALAKNKPGQLNFGSAGVGSATHFAMEVFKNKAGVNIVHIPYKGVPEALTDTMTGRVQLFISPLINAIPQVKGGKVVAVGIVEAVGPDVSGFKLGDRITYAPVIGAYCEIRNLPAERAILVPGGISDDEVAGMMLKGMTARSLLRRAYPVKQGDTILVHAAAGGVGLILCQWAKSLGATVLGTVGSEEKAALAAANGCDYPIQYREVDFVGAVQDYTNGQGVQAVYDGVGKDTFLKSLKCVAPFGTIVRFHSVTRRRAFA